MRRYGRALTVGCAHPNAACRRAFAILGVAPVARAASYHWYEAGTVGRHVSTRGRSQTEPTRRGVPMADGEARASSAAERSRRPGRPTMRDVAAHAGVSQSLVSLVFRDAPGASSETRER